jgi:CheY-like chemotaxis protein
LKLEIAMSALKKVLVVDDDPVVGKSIDRVLSEKGYAVITALNAEEALWKLAEANYDLVYTDIRMPGMDGIELAEHVKERRPWVPVVIVTGYGTDANEARARKAGVSSFLHKPLSPELIEDSARDALLEFAKAAARPEQTATIEMTQPAAAQTARASNDVARFAKSMGMLLAAPFVGLAFVVAAPFIGLGTLIWMGVRAMMKRTPSLATFVKNVALFLAAPFIGLAYALLFPFIALGMLALMGVRALVKRSPE